MLDIVYCSAQEKMEMELPTEKTLVLDIVGFNVQETNGTTDGENISA